MSNGNESTVEEILEESGPGFFSKLFHLWVLPFIYVLLLGSIILHFSGESFHSQLKWLQKQEAAIAKLFEKEEKAEKKTTTKTANSTADSQKTSTTTGNKSNTNTNQSSTAGDPQTKGSTGQGEATSVADSLSSMDPSKAAELLSNMTEAEALKNFKQLELEMQSAIIAELPAEEGARMIQAFSNEYEPATTTTSASQLYQYMKPEQIVTVLNGISSNEEVLYQIKQMDPSTASKVISQLNPKVAGWIVTQLKP